jgi:hypothetical protein
MVLMVRAQIAELEAPLRSHQANSWNAGAWPLPVSLRRNSLNLAGHRARQP